MNEQDVLHWVDAYEVAWANNDPDHIRALFTEDATYRMTPYREPWTGQDEIVAKWLEFQDEPGTWDFDQKVINISGDTAFVQGETVYMEPESITYYNLWVIRLAEDGRCREFTEWFMIVPDEN